MKLRPLVIWVGSRLTACRDGVARCPTSDVARNAGFSLLELLVVVVIISVLTLGAVELFSQVQSALGSGESRNALKGASQEAINRIVHALEQSKRIFQNDADGNAYVGGAQLLGAPAALPGSRLPTIEENGAVSPTSVSFVPAGVGNSLFFASVDASLSVTVNDGAKPPNPHTVRIDVYHFNYYYLGRDGGTIGGQPNSSLWEWHSIPYVDYQEINEAILQIQDATFQANLTKALSANYSAAWDSSATSFASAFYQLSDMGKPVGDAYQIPEADATNQPANRAAKMVSIIPGALSFGYSYSVSPNTGGSFQTTNAVPQFAQASGQFPSGFEVVVVGANSARQVYLRLVLVAKGAFKSINSASSTALVSARDVW